MRRSTFRLVLGLLVVSCGGTSEPAVKAPAAGTGTDTADVVKAVPEGFHSVTPHLVVSDVDAAIAYYQKAFGAERRYSLPGPDGKPMHAEIQIGDSIVMMSPESEQTGSRSPASLGGTCGSLLFYVQDVDAVHAAAVAAGGKAKTPVADMFWGDRYGVVDDPFGHSWGIATHKEVVSNEEMAKRAQAWGQAAAKGEKPPALEPGEPARHWKAEGYFSLTPAITVAGGAEVLEFYKAAFGAEVLNQLPTPDGRLMHAEMKIGDSVVMLGSEFPEMDPGKKAPKNLGAAPLSFMIYVDDADATFKQAVEAKAEQKTPMTDMFWGDRLGEVADPSGHRWGIATHKENLTPEQIQERMQKRFGGGAAPAE